MTTSTRDWSNLPFEILTLIFARLVEKHYYSRELGQCSLTCRNWNLAAQTQQFSTITLNR
jgi:hypothetical protein